MAQRMKLLHWTSGGAAAAVTAGKAASASCSHDIALRPYEFKKDIPDLTFDATRAMWVVHCTVDDAPDMQRKLDFAVQARARFSLVQCQHCQKLHRFPSASSVRRQGLILSRPCGRYSDTHTQWYSVVLVLILILILS